MSLLDRISKLEIGPKILCFIILAGAGILVIRLVFGLLSTVLSIFGTIGWILGITFLIYVTYKTFIKSGR